MRSAFLLLLIIAGGLRFQGDPVSEAPAGPPREIRIDGSLEPRHEASVRRIRDDFPSLERHRTSRFEILSDLDQETIAEHGQLLERTHHEVESFCKALGYELDVRKSAGHRHLVIAFADRADFLRFAFRHDKVHANWLAGYFAPVSVHLVYHTAADHPEVRRVVDRVENGEQESSETGDSRIRRQMNRFVVQADASVVVHEATHMLLHHHGVAPATSRQPMWLLEGLAGSFEPAEASRRFGPMRPENGRTKDFRELLRKDRVPGLKDLIREKEFSAGRGVTHANYATSAAFCSWLARHRPVELRRFLDRLNKPLVAISKMEIADADAKVKASAGGEPDPLEEFEAVFGDVERLEKAWLRHERAAASLPIAHGDIFRY